MKFKELNIISQILKALEKEQYETPSPIQEQAIPPALEGRDVLGCAQTGTGKTAAFAVPILQLLNGRPAGDAKHIRSLILTPTRELALQILESFQSYGRFLKLRCAVVFGGVSQVPQVNQLKRGVDILVATPGRLNDLIGQGIVDLSHVEIFVLDEADRMLDMGFIHDVKKVIAKLPQKKQTLFFSATMPPEIMELVDSLLVDPAKVEVTPQATTVDAIEQSVYFVDKPNKNKLLIHLLKDPGIESALVFTRTKHGADKVARELTRAKIRASAIHGNKSQSARQEALANFKNREIRVLVATDIAARGIDIEELSHVINYDLPNIPETYVHRIGRTGRAGLSGIAVSFCNIDEKPYLRDIQKLIGKEIPVVLNHPYPMEIMTPTPPKERQQRQRRQEQPGKAQKEVRPAERSGKENRQKREAQRQKPQTAPRPSKQAAAPIGKTLPVKRNEAGSKPAAPMRKAQPVKKNEAAPKPVPKADVRLTERPAAKPAPTPQKFVSSQTKTNRPSDQFLSNRHYEPVIRRKG